jgi:hypothetical protein
MASKSDDISSDQIVCYQKHAQFQECQIFCVNPFFADNSR